MKNAWAVCFGSVLCFGKFVFEFVTHPVVLLMASGALLLRLFQLFW